MRSVSCAGVSPGSSGKLVGSGRSGCGGVTGGGGGVWFPPLLPQPEINSVDSARRATLFVFVIFYIR